MLVTTDASKIYFWVRFSNLTNSFLLLYTDLLTVVSFFIWCFPNCSLKVFRSSLSYFNVQIFEDAI